MHRRIEVYLDESGGLGYSSSSTRHLVMVALATPTPHELSRIVRRARRKFGRADGAGSEFKFNRSGEQMRMFFLKQLAGADSWVVWYAVAKSAPIRARFSDGESLWFHAASRALAMMSASTRAKDIHLTIDRHSPSLLSDRRIADALGVELASNHAGYFPPIVTASSRDSMGSHGLQMADFVAGAVFHFVEREDSSYLSMIESIVRSRMIER